MASYHSKPSRVSSSKLSGSGNSGLEEDSGRFLTDSPADSMRITRMKTRVAVRDQTPHRFQVVPLRDVGKHAGTQLANSQWSAPSHSKNNARRNPSGKLVPDSQSRVFTSSSSVQSLSSVPSTADSHELDGPSQWELCINNTRATTSYNKALATFHTMVPSLALPHQNLKPARAKWDMNREGPIPRMPPSIAPTELQTNPLSGCQKSLPYPGFMNTAVRNELIPTHVTSQSLHNLPRQKRNYPKFASLSQSIDIPQRSPPTSFSGFENSSSYAQAKYRNVSEAETSIGEDFDLRGDNNFLLSIDIQNPKSNRRHAIYTESLYVPYLDEGCEPYSQGSTPKGSKFRSDTYSNFAREIRNEIPECTNSSHLKRPASEFRLEDNLANNASFAFTPVSTNPLPSNGLSLLPTGKARVVTLAAIRGLNYPSDKRSRARLLSGKDISHSEIVYPKIVLDLFAEIDLAIEQWKPVI